MSDRAKLFTSGGSQAVRLPKSYRFEDQDEVRISRVGERVILEPALRRWSRSFIEFAGGAASEPRLVLKLVNVGQAALAGTPMSASSGQCLQPTGPHGPIDC